MAPLPSSDLSEQKRALRREMSAARTALPEDERSACSEAASARLLGLLALPELAALAGVGRTIAGYVAAKGEIDPSSALAEVAAGGATVALPRVATEAPRLRFHRADAGPLTSSRFGLREPSAAAPEISLDALDVVIVPGLAFDAEGRRLGFGGGYYDGIFGALGSFGAGAPSSGSTKRPALIGLAYDFQIVARCPAGEGDVPVDLVVTDARVLRPARAPRAEGQR
jgi:5-formyltetrahydrofolate cyclo-ligase